MKALAAALLLAVVPLAGHAQDARYAPQPDSLRYRSLNQNHMFVVRGGDTLGRPVSSFTVERHHWTSVGTGLEAAVQQFSANLERNERRHVYGVAPHGRIASIDGEANPRRGAIDFFPVLPPSGRSTAGETWTDTLSRTRTDSAGEYVYATAREWRVAGTDPDGTVRMESTGTVRYRDVYPMGNAWWWIDVSGPAHGTARFDLARGRLMEQAWRMELRGTAGVPRRGGGVDTLPAGLTSALVRRLIDAETARMLMRPLPGRDTSYTSGERGRVLLHTTEADGSTVVSGMARADGMVGTARSEWAKGRQTRFEVTWSDSTAVERRIVVVPGESSLRLSGTRDTMVALPGGAPWVIADHGMEEQLVPALAGAVAGGRLAIFNPYSGRTGIVTVQMGELKGGRVYVLTRGEDDRTVLVVDEGGDLLVAAYSTGLGERLPAEGTARRARADALVEQLNARAPAAKPTP